MKKIQPIDESGRRMAMERYGEIEDRSKYGHSQMHRDMRPKFETPSHVADQRRGVQLLHDTKHAGSGPHFAVNPAEAAQDAPGSASGGSIKEVHPNINRRQYEKEHRGYKVGPTSHDHPHDYLKRPGGYGSRGAGGDSPKPAYPGKRNLDHA